MEHAVLRSLIGFMVILPFVDTSAEECIPQSWSHPWTKVGNTWYTKIAEPAIWDDSVTLCENVERGRTSIASVETEEEKKHLIGTFSSTDHRWWWIGGIRIGSNQWYWYKRVGGKAVISDLRKTYWVSGAPRDQKRNLHCILVEIPDGKWWDANCEYVRGVGGVICELRC